MEAGEMAQPSTAKIVRLLICAAAAILGWALSWLIGPGRLPPEELRPAGIVATVIMVILSAALLGLVGALIGRKLGRRAAVAAGARLRTAAPFMREEATSELRGGGRR